MAAEKLTDAIVKHLTAPASGEALAWDADVKGFGIRVTAAGAKAWIINYRASGRQRRLTIGSFPDWSAKAAREEAKALKRRIDQGEDPLGDRHADRAAPTMADLAEHYRRVHLPKKRPGSVYNDENALTKYVLPAFGTMKVAAIRHTNIAELHRKIAARYPTAANRTVALLSKMFNLAIKQGWIERNPCAGVELAPEQARERFLTSDEIARLMAALDQHPAQSSANAVRLLLLTGARVGEMLGATWSQFDLEAGVWTKPSSHTKQKKIHRVPLNATALHLLRDMRVAADAAVEEARGRGRILPAPSALFVGRTQATQVSLRTFWHRVRAQAGLADVRLHDLRHSYASILASSGLSLPLIGQLLGHTQTQTTARYAHLLDAPLRRATELVSTFVSHAVAAPPKVVKLPPKQS